MKKADKNDLRVINDQLCKRGSPVTMSPKTSVRDAKCLELSEIMVMTLEQTAAGIAVADLDGYLQYTNHAFASMHNYTADELQGKHLSIFHTPEQMPVVKAALEEIRTTGEHHGEIWHVRRDGTAFLTQMDNSLIRDKDGHPIGMIGTIRDITKHREAENALSITQFAIDHTSDAAFWIGSDAQFSYVNEAACRILGYSQEELLSMSVFDIDLNFTPENWPRHWQEIKKIKSFTMESKHKAKDGRIFPVEVTINYMEYKGREYNFAFAHDITQRKIAEELVEQHRAELAHASRLNTLGEMASGLAHELNQPLAAIINFARGTLRRLQSGHGDREDIINVIDNMASEAERAAKIIRHLRNLVQKKKPQWAKADINNIIHDAVDLLTYEARNKNINIKLMLDNISGSVLVDRIQIEQVIINLLRNAFEALEEVKRRKRSVTIKTSATRSNNMVEISIQDTGPGMTKETAENIFTPFFTTRPDGLGVGLSISRSIIKAHKGRLWATPGHRVGATFHFSLPIIHGDTFHDG